MKSEKQRLHLLKLAKLNKKPLIFRTCDYCGKSFSVVRSRVKTAKCCSRKCRYKNKKGKYIKCEKCGKDFYVTLARLRQSKKHNHKTRYCSQQCYSRKGKNNYFWKNGIYKDRDGYIKIYTDKGKIREHRYLAEKVLGRKLEKNEVIHHINGKRDDNRLENLRLMTKKEHDTYHILSRKNCNKLLKSNLCLN